MKYFVLATLLSLSSGIQLRFDPDHPIATKWDKENPHPGYQPGYDDFEGKEGLGKYDRDPRIPEHFSGPDSGDD
jgi:hypothetical protein